MADLVSLLWERAARRAATSSQRCAVSVVLLQWGACLLSAQRPPWRVKWRAHGQQGGSPLRALGMASATVRLPSGGARRSASPLAVDWRRFEVCWSSTALKVWFGQSCREAGIAADAGAARAISSIADCCSVVVTVVVVVYSSVVVEIS
jgi:hypothetical protein